MDPSVPESGSSSSSSSVPAEEWGVSNGIPDFQLLKSPECDGKRFNKLEIAAPMLSICPPGSNAFPKYGKLKK